jgi:hypothetical protein
VPIALAHFVPKHNENFLNILYDHFMKTTNEANNYFLKENKMKFLLLLSLVLNVAYAGPAGHEGGGGSIEDMRAAQSLSREQINKLIQNNGVMIKTQVLSQIPTYLKPQDIKDVRVKELYTKMTSSEISLVDDINFSTYSKDCACPAEKDMCTQDKNYANICFDVESLLKRKVNYAEFVGLLAHEYSHHFVGEEDHVYGLALAKFFEERARNNNLVGKTFTLINSDHSSLWKDKEKKSLYFQVRSAPEKDATFFCHLKNFTKAISFEQEKNVALNPDNFVYFDYDNGNKLQYEIITSTTDYDGGTGLNLQYWSAEARKWKSYLTKVTCI